MYTPLHFIRKTTFWQDNHWGYSLSNLERSRRKYLWNRLIIWRWYWSLIMMDGSSWRSARGVFWSWVLVLRRCCLISRKFTSLCLMPFFLFLRQTPTSSTSICKNTPETNGKQWLKLPNVPQTNYTQRNNNWRNIKTSIWISSPIVIGLHSSTKHIPYGALSTITNSLRRWKTTLREWTIEQQPLPMCPWVRTLKECSKPLKQFLIACHL